MVGIFILICVCFDQNKSGGETATRILVQAAEYLIKTYCLPLYIFVKLTEKLF